MTELDFLPDWYHVRRERRRSYFALVWLSLCLVGVMGLWFYLSHSRIVQARSELAQIKGERTRVNEELLRIDKLRAIRDDLAGKSTLAAELHNRPDAIYVVGRLVELLPSDIAMTGLDISSQTIKDKSSAPANSGPRRVSSRRVTSEPSDSKPTAERSRYVLTIRGVAPVDVTVANFIARLSSSDGFEQVHMGYARDLKFQGRLMREFLVTCQVDENWKPWESGQARTAAGLETRPTEGVPQAALTPSDRRQP